MIELRQKSAFRRVGRHTDSYVKVRNQRVVGWALYGVQSGGSMADGAIEHVCGGKLTQPFGQSQRPMQGTSGL